MLTGGVSDALLTGEHGFGERFEPFELVVADGHGEQADHLVAGVHTGGQAIDEVRIGASGGDCELELLGPVPVFIAGATMPAPASVARPTSRRSNNVTAAPARAARSAAAVPTTPPPITARSFATIEVECRERVGRAWRGGGLPAIPSNERRPHYR